MKETTRVVAILGVFILLLGLLYVRVREREPVMVDSGYRVIMGTFSRVVVIAESQWAARKCIEATFEIQQRIESLMSYHRADSELNTVNRYASEKPVPVNPMTFEVLQQAVHFSELSGGAFDVTVGPLVDLWRQAGGANEPPSEQALVEARAKVGYEKLLLDDGGQRTEAKGRTTEDRGQRTESGQTEPIRSRMTVRFAVPGMRIDLGGIGKGYAVDKSVEAMIKRGALGGMVDLGGNIRCFGRPPQGRECWRVGLQDPNVAPDDLAGPEPLLVLAITDESVATSGHYRRFVKVHGEKQSHILDAHTGRAATALASVTIIAPDATSADALSTAASVLGQEKGLALIETLPNIEAILIPAGQHARPIFTTGARAYLQRSP